MKKALLLLLLSICRFMAAQSNCASPTVVTTCPAVSLTGETTAGAGNERSAYKYYAAGATTTLNGNDKTYEVNLPVGAQYLWIDVVSTTGLTLIYNRNVCDPTYNIGIYNISSGCRNTSIYVAGYTKVYLWVDHNFASDITYDISFSVVTGSTYYPRGVLQPSISCQSPIFNSKFGLTYNGVQQPYPLVYSPLSASGTACYKIFLKNPSGGLESIKKIRFTFGADLASPTPASTSFPGFYSAGNWIATQPAANIIEYDFVSATGRGDFPNGASCAGYEFCFSFIPLSNNPATTTTSYTWWGDGAGNYTAYAGCFAATSCNAALTCNAGNCIAAGSGGVATGSGSTTDPFLPVRLTDFYVMQEANHNVLHWATASEENSELFEVEYSEDGVAFETLGNVAAAGNSNAPLYYSFKDPETRNTKTYYRLKEKDKDGTIQYSPVVATEGAAPLVSLHPNPAQDFVFLQSNEDVSEITILDFTGKRLFSESINAHERRISLSTLPNGSYVLLIQTINGILVERLQIAR